MGSESDHSAGEFARMGMKRRVFEQQTLTVPLCDVGLNDDDLASALADADMVFLDGQHGCFGEDHVPSFCARTEGLGVPVLYRIRHPELAYLIGVALDHGPAGIIVPQVERVETVRIAVESFYYPPLGNRGWGPRFGYGRKRNNLQEPRTYADWWNANGVLAIQLESVEAVRRARELTLSGIENGFGIDMVMFGPMDLGFSLDAVRAGRAPAGAGGEPASGGVDLNDLDACYEFVRRELADLPVKVTVGGNPFGVI